MKNNYPEVASIRQTVRNAIAIKERLGGQWVEAILVYANSEVVGEPITVGNTLVVSGSRLTDVIRNRRVRLTQTQADETAALLIGS